MNGLDKQNLIADICDKRREGNIQDISIKSLAIINNCSTGTVRRYLRAYLGKDYTKKMRGV